MARERRKIIRAGRLWKAVQYAATRESPQNPYRGPKLRPSDQARQILNAKTSAQKLLLLLYCNFRKDDLVVTLSYSDTGLAPNRDQANRDLTNFLRYLRKIRKAAGQPLYYIRVLEGDNVNARVHHHLILNATGADFQIIRDLWARYGENVKFDQFGADGPDRWSVYLTKWPRKLGARRTGERTWRASRGLKKPTVTTELVPQSDTLQAPPGSSILDRREIQNTYGTFSYCEAILPDEDL